MEISNGFTVSIIVQQLANLSENTEIGAGKAMFLGQGQGRIVDPKPEKSAQPDQRKGMPPLNCGPLMRRFMGKGFRRCQMKG